MRQGHCPADTVQARPGQAPRSRPPPRCIASATTPVPRRRSSRTSWAKTPAITGVLARDDGKAPRHGHRRRLFPLGTRVRARSPPHWPGGAARLVLSRPGSFAFPRVLIHDQASSGGSDAWCASSRRTSRWVTGTAAGQGPRTATPTPRGRRARSRPGPVRCPSSRPRAIR